MNVTLYSNTGDPRQLNKNLTFLNTTYAIQATDEISVTDPELIINVSALVDFNYVEIADFGRKYYVRSKTYLNGNQCRVGLHVDVLESFKNEINNSIVIADRSSNRNNKYIEDPVCGDAGSIQTEWRESGTRPFGYSTNNYVLMIAGR